MKFIFSIIGLLVCSFAIAQSAITGKWKPVYFSIDKLVTGDVKADTIFLSTKLDEAFKNDKDPQASKELMQMMAEMMLKKMKYTEEEFIAPNGYLEINTKKNTSNKGTYTFNGQDNLLTTLLANKSHTFIVSFKNDHLVLTMDLESSNGKKGEMQVEYERVK